MTPPSYPSNYEFSGGTEIYLTAVPEFFYRFNNWDGDLSGNTNPTTILIECNTSITANFSLNWPLVGGIICFVLAGAIIVLVLVSWKRLTPSKTQTSEQLSDIPPSEGN